MDVDIPVNLKRSSSAPMINELNTTMSSSTTTTSISRDSSLNVFSNSQPRTRRFSASFSPVHSTSVGPPRLTPRVSQLRQEECLDVVVREVAHERELHSTMVMSQSWEDLTIVPGSPSTPKTDVRGEKRPNQRVFDPLHLTLPPCTPMCSSPSPTRGSGRQYFSPGLSVWKTGLSPSPTRKSFATRRSLSPIAMRPSPLGPVKRKFELEDEKLENCLSPPAKRQNSFSGSDRGGLLMTNSPLPGSLSSVGTPESLSSADSPGFMFRPVDSPSPGRPNLVDEPMHEDQKILQQDTVMTPVEQSPS